MAQKIKIAFFDIDGTLQKGPSSWEILHIVNNTWETLGTKYLERYVNKEISFEKFAALDVAAWKGMSEKVFNNTLKKIPIFKEVPLVFKYLQDHGVKIYIISSGISRYADYLCRKFKLDAYIANDVHVKDGKLTGKIKINVPYTSKGEHLKDMLGMNGLRACNALAIGDGEGDIPMFNEVHHPIYFSPKNKKMQNYDKYSASTWIEILNYIQKIFNTMDC